MKIEEVVHYLLRVNQKELRVIRDALDFYLDSDYDMDREDVDIYSTMKNIINEMI